MPPESFGNLLQHFTGSKEHNVAMREDAVRRGLSISEYGVTNVETRRGLPQRATRTRSTSSSATSRSRPSCARTPASSRRRARGELPELVELRDVRGDLHTHSHWSADGKSTLEEMVEAAAARGYEYYAVTDHSHYLREGRLHAQLEEIERCASGSRSCGSSPASRRTSARTARSTWPRRTSRCSTGSSPPCTRRRTTRPTERVLEAMENPYVDCIGHLTGRRIGKRPPRDVDVERVIEGALETGTLLEINGQPDRLDLRDVHARAAKEAGLKLVVSSDAHQVRAQAYVELAVAQARRGWLTKADVANTRTWKQLDKLRKKRP